ncbi:hypothetical protein [Ochrobactrum sp. A-1]|uniref:hypothetical protein n=1 Tax=Ochrobactrum sp. A-1 TaxID=2920940 RepID=UPI001F0B5B45|nr:hypothetical protein [Ochrobactrum sp. A-1]
MTNFIPTTSLAVIDGEPCILDVDLAERLDFGRSTSVRILIERNRDELEMYGSLHRRDANPGKQGGRPGKAYYLNEGQALVICALSRTPKAAQIRKLIIDVFMDWRQGKLVHVKEHNRRPPAPRVPEWSTFKLQLLRGGHARIEAIVPFDVALEYFNTYRQLNVAS